MTSSDDSSAPVAEPADVETAHSFSPEAKSEDVERLVSLLREPIKWRSGQPVEWWMGHADAEYLAHAILASDWLAERDQHQRETAWDSGHNAACVELALDPRDPKADLGRRDEKRDREAAVTALEDAARDAANTTFTDDAPRGYAIWLWNTERAKQIRGDQ